MLEADYPWSWLTPNTTLKAHTTFTFILYRYFFPTYENDNLLYALGDEDVTEDEATGNQGDNVVIAEDISFDDSLLKNQDVLQELMTSSKVP